MLKIGLTGGIGSGKTTVSNVFAGLGVPVIDTDVIARELVEHNPDVLNEIVSIFGHSVLNDDGTLNRKTLASVVFHEVAAKRKLENILHPRIRSHVINMVRSCQKASSPPPYVIIVIPLLFETGFRQLIDRILVVISDETTRIERIRQRDNRSTDEIRSIINSQVSDETRISEADDVVYNNLPLKALETEIMQLHEKYLAVASTMAQT